MLALQQLLATSAAVTFAGERIDTTTRVTAADVAQDPDCAGELLHNNICLPPSFPAEPRINLTEAQRHYQPPPYLANRRPVNISVGRQLFVDEFLVAKMDGLQRTWYQARMSKSAAVKADKPWETHAGGLPGCGGVWWVPLSVAGGGHYRLYYDCGCDPYGFCVATSVNGEDWSKPAVGSNGTNCLVLPDDPSRVPPFFGGTVWLDLEEPEPTRRWKLAGKPHCSTKYQHLPACSIGRAGEVRAESGFANGGYRLYGSADGYHFVPMVNKTGLIGDTSSTLLAIEWDPRTFCGAQELFL